MPQNTRVYRCVKKLRKRYGYSSSIGICQRSTKQSYMTGKRLTLQKRRTRRRKTIRRKRKKRKKRKRNTTKNNH